jgi:uncharacterized protein YegL
VIDSGSNSKGPQFGGSEVKIVVKPAELFCRLNEKVQSNACVACEPGTVHAAGADASKANTACKGEVCKDNERVMNSRCTPCLPGEKHEHDEVVEASGGDTQCEAILCKENESVQNNVCVRCFAGSKRPAGDRANSYNTFCEKVMCEVNQIMRANQCVDCPKGQTSHGGQETECETTVCDAGQKVTDFRCETCPVGYTHEHIADATEGETECEVLECRENENFDGASCVSCPPGHSHPGRSNIFDDKDCTVTTCGDNEEYDGTQCVTCPPGTHGPGGHVAGDDESACSAITCAANEAVKNSACISCPVGHVAEAGHSADGDDFDCSILVCPAGNKVSGYGCISCDADHEESNDPNVEDGCKAAVRLACAESDVIFLMDMSGSIGVENFQKMKEYVIMVATIMDVSPNGAHASLITFADTAQQAFDFDAGTNLVNFEKSVNSISYRPGKDTYIDKGLNEANRLLRAHSEPGTPKIVILLTDGQQTGGGKDVLPAASAPLFALGADVVVIGIGEEVDPNELQLIVDNPNDIVLSDYERIEQQLEVLVLRICLGTQHGPDGKPIEQGLPPTPVNALADAQDAKCMVMEGEQCRAERSTCDWCRFRDLCHGPGRCPGGRRSADLPEPETLNACECTPSGPKWSSITESHFCWMRETPCRAKRDEVLIQTWADCEIDVDCPRSGPDELKHIYQPPLLDGQFNPQECFEVAGPRKCRGEDSCSWCPAFKGCAPRGQCASLKTRDVVTLRTNPDNERAEMDDAYNYMFDNKDTNVFVAAPKSFRETLNTVMIKTLGVEVDPSTDRRCLSTENFCAAVDQEYCCQWQSNLVHFYRRLSQELGPSTDPRTKTRCTAIEGPCITTGQEYCCAWQTNLMTMFA